MRPTATRRLVAVGTALLVAGVVAVTAPVMVAAGTGTATGTGSSGQTLTVTPSTDLDPAGETVTVTGTGYAVAGFDLATEGIYVGLCVDRGAGLAPSPCVGGVDLEGETGSSRWVTNNPIGDVPAVPIAADGSFSTTITIPAADEFVDCQALPAGQSCKVVTRMDHRASGDRSQDVKVPVTFGDGTSPVARISVSPSTNVDPAGADLVVTGNGFPTTAPGAYVVFGPAVTDPVDAAVFGASVFVPHTDMGADGSFTVTLPGVTAAYTDGNGVARDFSAGGGRVSTLRAQGAADPDGQWRTSAPVAFAGAPLASSTTALAIAPTTVAVGANVVMTATVTVAEPTATAGSRAGTDRPAARATATGGTVEFFDGTRSLGTAVAGVDGKATRTASFPAAGTRQVTARFLGTDTAAASTSAAVAVTVRAADPPPPDPDPDPDDTTPSGTRTGTGTSGQTITATPVDNLDPDGTQVRVDGAGFTAAAGFDIATDGMYLSFCVDNGPGVQPSPCVGGADTEGESGASQWVTNNPYEGVPASAVTPVAADGSFSTTITVRAADEYVDCLALAGGGRCVITTRMDHRATADRSQDVKVAVCFAGEAACATDPIPVSNTPTDGSVFTGYRLDQPTGTVGATGGSGTRGLTATGNTPTQMVSFGLVLLALGAALVLVARRTAVPPTSPEPRS